MRTEFAPTPVVPSPRTARSRDGRHGYDDLEPDLHRLGVLEPDDPGRSVLRDRLIREFLPLVRNLSRRYASAGVAAEDVEQAGVLGLIKAIDRYDPAVARGSALRYLVPSVRGEMLRYLRDHTWPMRVPRDIKDLGVRIGRATRDLTQRLGRAPRPSELAVELDVGTEKVVEALTALDCYRPESLDKVHPDDDIALGDRLGHDDPELELAAVRHDLRTGINALPERERRILLLRFYGNRTQSEIAAEMGISQMHVSRLLTRTVRQLRTVVDG